MSVVAMYRGGNGIVIAADGVTYDDEGICRGFVSKIHYLPAINCAIAQVGAGGLSLALLQAMGHKYQTFDGMLGGITSDLRIATEWGMLHYTMFGKKPDSTVAIAGYSSARERFEVHRVSNWNKEVVGQLDAIPAYEVRDADGFWANTVPSDEMSARLALNPDAIHQNPTTGCARWICACRPDSRPPSGDLPAFGCGGFLELAILRNDSYESKVVHRWPDEIGKPIDPAAGELCPAWLMPTDDDIHAITVLRAYDRETQHLDRQTT